ATNDALSVGGKALQPHVGVVDDIAVAVHAKGTRPGITAFAGIVDDEKSLAIDGQVQAVFGERQITLTKILADVLHPNPITDLGGAAVQEAVGIKVAKFRPRLLEAGGAGIGDVVARDLQVSRGSPDTC